MLCPICRTELIVTGQERLETLSEHVCDPNGEPSLKDKYECPNRECVAFGELCWNDWGERYGGGFNFPEELFIYKNDAPFGSFQRKANVEIGKHDEDHPLFGLETRWGLIRVVYKYTSNTDGDILSRKRTYEIWSKDRGGIGYYVHPLGIHMLIFCIKDFHRKLKQGRLDKEDLYPRVWDKRWWKKLSCWYSRMFLRTFRKDIAKKLLTM